MIQSFILVYRSGVFGIPKDLKNVRKAEYLNIYPIAKGWNFQQQEVNHSQYLLFSIY